jgi:Nickel responsive protein SCO4226-like
MPEFVIEREVPGLSKMPPAEMEAVSRKSLEVLRDLGPGIRWLRSYVTDDKLYCVYYASNAELIREHARRCGVPANRVEAVRGMLDPADFKN